MAVERRLVQETITNLKRALAARDDASDSDDTIVGNSNRGRKLKRKAQNVHEGKLDDGRGVNGYKEEIEYFGRRKKIIYRKPSRRKKIAVDSDEEDSQSSDAEGSVDESTDPYEGLDIAKLLAPLDSAADLPSHPSLAYIYTSRTLNELLQQSLVKICEEQAHTVKLKNLLTKFLGDDPFINLEKMHWTEEDHTSMTRERSEGILRQFSELTSNGNGRAGATNGAESNGKLANGTPKPAENGVEPDDEISGAVNGITASGSRTALPDSENKDTPMQDTAMEDDDTTVPKTEDPSSHDEEMREASAPPEPRRMTTRSANQNNGGSPAPPSEAPSIEIDPFFFPPDYKVDRDNGLPPAEAEETRRLLSAAVQRQDEFLRGLKKVHDGLLRAESMRKKVWDWCRTMEGMREYHKHLTEVSRDTELRTFDIDTGEGVGLSDGEDWYDMDGWKLEEPLEKGREEEDEGDIVTHGKKTRRRGDR
ncbi:RXT2-like protein [Tricharina praecox]|uniref:RXT2-like protein n=1 Tax=Tricharina praecox TaxID=43433 RepID=UPI00221E3A25|nr:RXT2-like protein [Tricharina praecox]KAI5855631.1 RXT2-like protein [Tricharina praecox]